MQFIGTPATTKAETQTQMLAQLQQQTTTNVPISAITQKQANNLNNTKIYATNQTIKPAWKIFKSLPPTTKIVTSIADPTEAAVAAVVNSGQKVKKMEHSYMRDDARNVANNIQPNNSGLTAARTILVRRAPQCPSCHTHPMEEEDLDDDNKVPVPTYNELLSKESMNECTRIAKYVKNVNSDDDDWEEKIVQFTWTTEQKDLFAKVADILNKDRLARLAIVSTMNEVMQRRILVDTSAARLRKVLAGVYWDVRLTQWLHGVLMDSLPSEYMGAYLDILQTLKTKVSTSLLDKMLFGRPLTFSQELLVPVLKQRWEPFFTPKQRKPLPNLVMLVIPSHFGLAKVSRRQQRWLAQLSTFGAVETITLPTGSGKIFRQPVGQIAEQIVSLARVKIQELRNDETARHIILVGFNAGSAMAIQVAMSANVTGVICLGFAYNTLTGVRGAPDDRILDVKLPILFVIGQNAARTSQEEMESLRERMQSETSLVIVGCADDVLRVPRSKRRIENVTQTMVDHMITDEVYDYIKRILANPPGPRTPISITGVHTRVGKNSIYQNVMNDGSLANADGKTPIIQRKRKLQEINANQNEVTPKKYVGAIGRPRVRPLVTNPGVAANNTPGVKKIINLNKPTILSNEDLSEAMQSILAEDSNDGTELVTNSLESSPSGKPMQSFELIATPSKTSPLKATTISPTPIGSKIKLIPSNQFVQLKPGAINNMQTSAKIYKIESPPAMLNTANTGIGSIVSTTGNISQPKIIQIKNPMVTNQQKFTIVKSPNGTTRFKLNNPTTVAANNASNNASDVDISNIINMPIVFADQQGNITGQVASQESLNNTSMPVSTTPSNNFGKYIISQKIIKPATPQTPIVIDNKSPSVNISGKTFILNKSTNATLPTTQKLVFVNRNNLTTSASNIVGGNVRMMMSNAKPTTVSLGARTQIVPITGAAAVSSTIKQLNMQSPKLQFVNNPINTTGNIILKPGQFKTMNIKPQILNGLPGVRKFINFVPMSKSGPTVTSIATTSTKLSDLTGGSEKISSATGTPIQTAPKIITLDPISIMAKDDKSNAKDAQSEHLDSFN